MMLEGTLLEKLRKIEALFAGAATVGIGRIEQVVFHVNLRNEIVERENPLFRRGEAHVIADVVVRLDPRTLERRDEVPEVRRRSLMLRADLRKGGAVRRRDERTFTSLEHLPRGSVAI